MPCGMPQRVGVSGEAGSVGGEEVRSKEAHLVVSLCDCKSNYGLIVLKSGKIQVKRYRHYQSACYSEKITINILVYFLYMSLFNPESCLLAVPQCCRLMGLLCPEYALGTDPTLPLTSLLT